MNAEYRYEDDGTVFRFCLTEKGFDDGGYYWTDAPITVNNWCFAYQTSSSCFEFSELVWMNEKLQSLLKDEILAVEEISFIEPDVKIVLHPKHDIRESGEYVYVKSGHEIEDIKADFIFYPFLDGCLTEQRYVLPLYRDGIRGLTEYLSESLNSLK